jgi:malto-oligosyltrehalose trehalohydrolase
LIARHPRPSVRLLERCVTRSHGMPFGAQFADGRTRFRLWAPAHRVVRLKLEGRDELLEMSPVGAGVHELITPLATAGSTYRYVLSDGTAIADPASRHQPSDANGPSEVIDPASYRWRDAEWHGRPWSSAVIYELHVGAFTPEGSFKAAIDKLAHLADLGITMIEVMPIADFPGERNWGYDGVLLFAPDSSYGRPDDLKEFIEAAHGLGLAVILDVVYNHFGPDGNVLPACSPAIFTDRHHTPWGAAVNFDGEGSRSVRELVIHNALYWIEEFHFDGLRLDAVHAIIDDSPEHVLVELARRVRASAPEREIHLLIENEENDPDLINATGGVAPKRYDAQWNDDVHHVLHVAATGESNGYYEDYLGDTWKLTRALAEGFAFQGEVMAFRGTARGKPSAHLHPTAFVAFIQNHDQVGNRAFGERIGALASPERLRAISAIHLLLPQIPLIFMGEEWGADQPFLFFADFHGELAHALRAGRRQEFARFPEFADQTTRERIPDPLAHETFLASKLDWRQLERGHHALQLDRYRRLLQVRYTEIVPLLDSMCGAGRYRVLKAGGVVVEWTAKDSVLQLIANLSDSPMRGPLPVGRELWGEGVISRNGRCVPWGVRWALLSR